MSRVGKQPIPVPADVKVSIKDRHIVVEGKKGKLEFTHHAAIAVAYDAAGKVINVTRPNDERTNRALHGLTRSLVFNMVHGVSTGYEKKLKIEGLGYQARILPNKSIELSVGYANKIVHAPPAGVTVTLPDPKDPTVILVAGSDKQKVGQFAAEVRSSRKPEPYKGKGVRYDNETVRRKEGKSFASGG